VVVIILALQVRRFRDRLDPIGGTIPKPAWRSSAMMPQRQFLDVAPAHAAR
jgi:hypothetical protein